MKITPILFLFLSTKNYTQEINFKHLSGDDGLSQNFISCILQDQKGFMWFGTKDGLNRYDGYSFVVYQHDPFDTTTISDNFITALFEDSRGNIWVGTLNGGLNCFERSTETFHHIRYNFNSSTTYNSQEISSISEDSLKNIWIATRGDGVFKLSLDRKNSFEFKYNQFSSQSNKANRLSSNIVSTLYFDSKGVLWLGTLNGLDKFDIINKRFTHYQLQLKNPKAPANYFDKTVYSIHESSNGKLWLGTLSGLVEFDKHSGAYKLFPHHYDVYRYGWGNIIKIVEDASGKMWLATSGELMRFDPRTSSYDYFRNDFLNPRSISYNSISSLYIDKTGVLWVGTAGMGIDLYDPKVNRFSTFFKKSNLSRITGFSVRCVLEESEDIVWISTDVLFRWNRKTGEIESYETNSNRPDDFGNTGAWSMIKSHDGKIWAATNEGVYSYDLLSNKIRQYKFNTSDKFGLPQKEAYAVFEDHQNNLWVATENFFCKLVDIDKGTFQNYRYMETLPYNQRTRPVIYQDAKDNFWIGTRSGLLFFDLQKKSFYTYKSDPKKPNSLNNNIINSICPDPLIPDSVLWLGTSGGGINRFNISSGTFTHFTEKDGLPNNVVYGLLPDEKGNLWLSTNNGLSKFNANKITFRNFNVNDGLQSNEFNTGAFYRSNSGELFFGGIKGLNYFFPKNIVDNPFVPEISIINVSIRNFSSQKSRAQLRKQYSNPGKDKLILSDDNDVITFEFAALDYSAPEKNMYAYMLENLDETWIYSGTKNTATYTNLKPGDYIFKVKGSNNDGLWNEKGAAFYFTINPPWWITWWAYSFYGIVLLSALYFLRRYELNRLKLKNQLRLEKVETDALRNLDYLKSHFFENLSHEFRTPLTLILGQIESVMSSNIENKEKSKLQVANRNARRLLTLINQLLDLSKIEAGSMKLNSEQHNIVSFIKSLFYSFESLAETKKITLKFETVLENIPVVFDPDKMEKVFNNLLSNAFKFTPPQGEIKVFIKKADSKFVEIYIRDTGIGIPGNRIKHIFNRFYQVDSSTTRDQEGTGIGLALTVELVELHKGKIDVKSKEGEGSEFIISLPIGNIKNDQEKLVEFSIDSFIEKNELNEIEIQEENLNQNLNAGDSKKDIVLIVEDNKDVRAYISEQLRNDYRIFEASNGKEGYSLAQNTIPDLIISDIMMPIMDGYQLCKAIRADEKTSHIPIIMLTAKAGLDNKTEGLETGVDDYLTKPFSAKELRVRVKNLIYLRAQLRKRFSKATIIKPSEVTIVSVDQEFLQRVIKSIETNIENEQFGVEKLSNELNMSVSQLNRKLNALVDQPAGQLIRSLRLQRAADLLKQNAGTVAEICYKVGFNDQAYFSRAFKKQFNCSPSDFKKNFSA